MLVYTDNGIVDPWLVSQTVIASTTRLAPLVAVQPVYMHPYSVAKMVSTLAYLHGRAGRPEHARRRVQERPRRARRPDTARRPLRAHGRVHARSSPALLARRDGDVDGRYYHVQEPAAGAAAAARALARVADLRLVPARAWPPHGRSARRRSATPSRPTRSARRRLRGRRIGDGVRIGIIARERRRRRPGAWPTSGSRRIARGRSPTLGDEGLGLPLAPASCRAREPDGRRARAATLLARPVPELQDVLSLPGRRHDRVAADVGARTSRAGSQSVHPRHPARAEELRHTGRGVRRAPCGAA